SKETGVDDETTSLFFERSNRQVKDAIVMLLLQCSRDVAVERLDQVHGSVRQAINLYTGCELMRIEQLAWSILSEVGGTENIQQIAFCMTRLRLTLKDETKINEDQLKQIEGVMGVVWDTTLQIVIGPGRVVKVAKQISEWTGLRMGGEDLVDKDRVVPTDQTTLQRGENKPKDQSPVVKKFLRRIGNIFIPLIPGLVASGIINGVANFLKNAGFGVGSTWMNILLLLGSSIFTYLAILVGWNTAKEFEGTPVLGALAGMFLFNPMLAEIAIYGDELVVGRGGLFGVIFVAWLMTFVEKRIRKIIPE